MGTVRRNRLGSAGLPDVDDVFGEPVYQGAAGTQQTGKHSFMLNGNLEIVLKIN